MSEAARAAVQTGTRFGPDGRLRAHVARGQAARS
jgi:hypothetical protein